MEKKEVRVQLVTDRTQMERLDAWRAKQRIWSRSEAIRRLIDDGLDAAEKAERSKR